jgi:hypothetical protein
MSVGVDGLAGDLGTLAAVRREQILELGLRLAALLEKSRDLDVPAKRIQNVDRLGRERERARLGEIDGPRAAPPAR